MNMFKTRRRNFLGGVVSPSPPLEYVSGLSLWLDAIDNAGTGHDATYKDWKDKVNGLVFLQNGTKAFESNYFAFTGSEYFTCTQTKKRWGTIEVVFESTTSETHMIFSSANSTGSGGTVSCKSGAVLFDAGGAKSATRQSGRHTYTFNGTNIYVDGEQVNGAGITVSWTAEPSTWNVGIYGSGTYKLKGKIYAIRCYDKNLTASEIAQNAAVDAARFG